MSPPELIDIGVNLAHKRFRPDLDAVLGRARAAGVVTMVATGTSLAASHEALELARRFPGAVYATAGVHPHAARTCDDATITSLRALARQDAVVAIGECGLDYDRDFSPRPVQRRWFIEQLSLARECGLPLFLHERSAHDDFMAILREHAQGLTLVVHCFTGDQRELEAYVQLGAYVGITGFICDERRGTHLKALMPMIPRQRLMLETDAPFLLPRSVRPRPRGSRCEPAHLPHVLATVAQALPRDPRELAEETTDNATRFFRLPQRDV